MSGSRGRKLPNAEKHFPGCLGGMVNLFDLSAGIGGTKLLTDKPHNDASLSRSRSDVATMGSLLYADQIHDKMVISELRRTASNRLNGTPIKKLMAREMLNEREYKQSPTNVVAKLMGLETLPHEQLDISESRNTMQYSQNISKGGGVAAAEYWNQCFGFADELMRSEDLHSKDDNEYKDVYEIPELSHKKSHNLENILSCEKYDDNPSERKKVAVIQKFLEAKRMVTDEKLRHSKKFQDAVEVLSSNKDLFLRFLHESNSLSQHLYDTESITPTTEAKRITILRPSRVADRKSFAEQETKSLSKTKKAAPIVPSSGCESIKTGHSLPSMDPRVEYSRQATRIVVLKPSPRTGHDMKAAVSSSPSSPGVMHSGDYFKESEDARETRAMKKSTAGKISKNFSEVQSNEGLVPSMYFNTCDDDDGFLSHSDSHFVAENLSEMETMSLTSRHSWDYVTSFDNPYYCSSFSRATNSPESSVCREAKKRLSERWALMVLNETFSEQKHASKSSSTLGEMLALSDIKEAAKSVADNNFKEEPRSSTSCLTGSTSKEGVVLSPNNLQRSKSLPVSSKIYGNDSYIGLSESKSRKDHDRNLENSKSVKPSLKGKVSSFFFSRSKKSTKQSSGTSQLINEPQTAIPDTPKSCVSYGTKASDPDSLFYDEGPSPGYLSHSVGQTHTRDYLEVEISLKKPTGLKSSNETLEQPSPCSVLEPPFFEDDPRILASPSLIKPPDSNACQKSNFIDKSPPIGSIARMLPLDAACSDTASQYPIKSTPPLPGTREDDWHLMVHNLLSVSGLDVEAKPDEVSMKWQSHGSPLDPSLRSQYAGIDETPRINEAKRRQQRSKRKLVFDLVNMALLELADKPASTWNLGKGGVCDLNNKSFHSSLEEYVWAWTQKWLLSGDDGDRNRMVVGRVVKEEVAGNGWTESMGVEFDSLRKELEMKLVEEIVEECVTNLTNAR